jgi:hypothetical protein
VTSDDRDEETATKQDVVIDTSAVAHADLTLEQRVDATLARSAPFVPADSEPSTLEPNFAVRGLGARGRIEDAPTGRLEDAPTARRGSSMIDEEEKATRQFDSRGILEAFDASLDASSRTLQRPAAGQPPAVALPHAEHGSDDAATMLRGPQLGAAALGALEPVALALDATRGRPGGDSHPALGEQPTVSLVSSAAARPHATGEPGLSVVMDVDIDPDEFGSSGGTKKIVITPEDVAEIRRGEPPRGSPQRSGAEVVAHAPGATPQGIANLEPMRAVAVTMPLIVPNSADGRAVAGTPMSQGAPPVQPAPPRVATRPEPVAALTQPPSGGGAVSVLPSPPRRGRVGRVVLVLGLLVASVGGGSFYVKRRGVPVFVTRLLHGRVIAAAPAAVPPASSAAPSGPASSSSSSASSSSASSSSASSASLEAPASSVPAGADSSSPPGASASSSPASSSASPSSSPSASPSSSSSSHRGGAHPPRPRAPKPATSKAPP